MYLGSACCSSMKTAGWAERSCEGSARAGEMRGWGRGPGEGGGTKGDGFHMRVSVT